MIKFIYILLFCACDAYKLLLFFPIPGKSHAILGETFVHHLVNAGHEITYVAPFPLKNPLENVRHIDISENTSQMPVDKIFDVQKLMYKELDLQNIKMMLTNMGRFMNTTLHIDGVQKLMHDPNMQFDGVIVEWLSTELGAGLSNVFDCPLIWFSSMEPHSSLLSLVDDILNPSYTVYIWARDYSLDFYSRIKHLYLSSVLIYNKWLLKDIDNSLYEGAYRSAVESRGRSLTPFEVVKYNASLLLGNSHVSSGEAISVPQIYKAIGGFHIQNETETLPKNLQEIMDKSTHGVIYFSLGTMLQSSALPDAVKHELLVAFGKLNQTIIWKYAGNISNLPKNVHLVPWLPQKSILAHPKTVLFITHGGLLSIFETLHCGVPIIGIPMYGDQFINVNRAVNKGFGKRFNLGEEPIDNLIDNIKDIIKNTRYRDIVKKLSLVYHDRPATPGAELVHWVEHVLKTQGAIHMRSPALHVPFYQKYYLDFIAANLILLSLIFIILIRIIKWVTIGIKFTPDKDKSQ